eukprot:15241045-Alexandrium_andersonii.AAC.1
MSASLVGSEMCIRDSSSLDVTRGGTLHGCGYRKDAVHDRSVLQTACVVTFSVVASICLEPCLSTSFCDVSCRCRTQVPHGIRRAARPNDRPDVADDLKAKAFECCVAIVTNCKHLFRIKLCSQSCQPTQYPSCLCEAAQAIDPSGPCGFGPFATSRGCSLSEIRGRVLVAPHSAERLARKMQLHFSVAWV